MESSFCRVNGGVFQSKYVSGLELRHFKNSNINTPGLSYQPLPHYR